MMFHLEFTHTIIPWLFSAMLLAFTALWLVRHHLNTFYPPKIRLVLSILRGLTLVLLALLLLDMKITGTRMQKQDPALAIVWDLSRSMRYAGGPTFSPADFLQSDAYRHLRREFRVDHIAGMRSPEILTESELRRSPLEENFTDCGKLLRYAEARAVYGQAILISDGQSYLGESLEAIRLSKDMRVHSLRVGAAATGGAPLLRGVRLPDPLFRGDSAEAVWTLHNDLSEPFSGLIAITEGEKEIFRETVDLPAGRMREFATLLAPEHEGPQVWRWHFIDGDDKILLGTRSATVRPSRIRVLCDDDPADRDLAMVATVLGREERIELFRRESWEREHPDETPDLLIQIWHPQQQPLLYRDIPAILFYREKGDAYTPAADLRISEYRPYLMFTPDPAENETYWRQLPPLHAAPYSGEGRTLVSTSSGQPVIVEDLTNRRIIIPAAGLWRWQLAAYRKPWEGAYGHLILGLVRDILSADGTGIISFDKDEYTATQYFPLQFSLGVRDPCRFRDVSARISISLLDTALNELRRIDPPLNAAIHEAFTLADSGAYVLSAQLFANGQTVDRDTARVRIFANDQESAMQGCDTGALIMLSSRHGGVSFSLAEADSLRAHVRGEKTWVRVTRSFEARKAWGFYLLMFLMMCADWILRKRNGGI
ncbi:MAG: hypothetical protein JXR21_02745 [Candidatus Marinimicrobia bacterium]|nr:hypothetical protein [Candidatus Neomarinimicrobiota bacterium]